jgi:hypothetical protein
MTNDYSKENYWYAHNGGPCPAHPETVIRVLHENGQDWTDKVKNLQWGWGVDDQPRTVAAWMITRLYVEPRKAREWWVNRYYGSPNDDTLFASRAEADSAALDENRIECVHVREVLGDDDAH